MISPRSSEASSFEPEWLQESDCIPFGTGVIDYNTKVKADRRLTAEVYFEIHSGVKEDNMRRASSLRPSAHAEIQAAIHDELDDIVEEKISDF